MNGSILYVVTTVSVSYCHDRSCCQTNICVDCPRLLMSGHTGGDKMQPQHFLFVCTLGAHYTLLWDWQQQKWYSTLMCVEYITYSIYFILLQSPFSSNLGKGDCRSIKYTVNCVRDTPKPHSCAHNFDDKWRAVCLRPGTGQGRGETWRQSARETPLPRPRAGQGLLIKPDVLSIMDTSDK